MSQRYPSPALPSKRAGAFYACYFGVLGAVLPFLGPFLADRGLGPVAVGLATAAFSLAKLAYTPLVGRWVDRGRWFSGILTAHMALAVGASTLVFAVREPWLLGAALLVIGLGYGTVLPLVEAAVLERMPRGGYGLVRWWGSIGFVAVAGCSAVVVGSGRFDRFPILLTALLVVLTISCLPLESQVRPARTDGRRAKVGAAAWLLLVVLTFNQIAHGPYYAFFSIHLRDHGIGPAAVAALWSLAVLAELAAFALGPRIERRLGRRRLLGLALGLAPVRWLLLALPPIPPVLVLAQVGHALTFAAAHLAGVQLVQEVVPAGARRNAQALYSGLCFGLGIVVGTAAAGPLYAAASGSGSFLAAAGLSGIVALAWWGIGRRIVAGEA
jgi:PPP family 3-phenylpropionic acid transporter